MNDARLTPGARAISTYRTAAARARFAGDRRRRARRAS